MGIKVFYYIMHLLLNILFVEFCHLENSSECSKASSLAKGYDPLYSERIITLG
jgi:hypothetical protein